MYTIKKSFDYELIIKNSRFIASIHPIREKSEVEKILKEIQQKYPKATHYTYAYRTKEAERSSDDGEPGGTAGMPILNVLQKQEMTNILVVVIRYFGGIKLGAGGLVRAYSKTCKEALENAQIIELIPAKKIIITTDYNKGKELDYILKNAKILNKSFEETITYSVLIEDYHILDGHFSYQIIGDDDIEKER